MIHIYKMLIKSWRYFLLGIAILAHIVLILVVNVSTSEKEKREDNTIFKVVDVTEYEDPPEEKVIKKLPPPPPPKKIVPVKQLEVAPQDDVTEDVKVTEKEVIEEAQSSEIVEINYLPQHKISNAPGIPTKEVMERAVKLYPTLANKQKIEGVVILELYIDQYGNIRDIKILKEPGYGLGEAAVKAIEGLKCAPALANGKSVAVRFRYPVRFKLK